MYNRIDDYGIIGDTRSAALVSREGSVDYCSLPEMDSPTLFASLLDDEKGGYFRIRPRREFEANQKYIPDTNILVHEFRTGKGEAKLFLFMPVSKNGDREVRGIHACLRVVRGRIDFQVEFRPRPGYARILPRITRDDDLFRVLCGDENFSFRISAETYRVENLSPQGVDLRLSLNAEEDAHFDIVSGEYGSTEIPSCGFDSTKKFWEDWLKSGLGRRLDPPPKLIPLINRSLLVLKLLAYRPSGAVAAAPTTSLPEVIGGERNWDYRFSWIRDASFTLKAFFNYGFIEEAQAYVRWLQRTYKRSGSRGLRIMYSLKGEDNLEEKELGHLKGYRNSRPVRVGNNAFRQNQWDIYGEIMDTALLLSDYAGKIDESLWPFFIDVCNLAAENWKKPDEGIWEVRNGPFHFVYSKAMCWTALDRGITIARRYGFEAPLSRWESGKKEIERELIRRGYDPKRETFVQRYGGGPADASLLLLGIIGFLRPGDKKFRGTVENIRRELLQDGFLLRYRADDGLEGEEGAFLLCSFWLIEALTLIGDRSGAEKLLKSTVAAANHLGLLSEEYDYANNQLLGNFPQAFSHIGFLNAVHRLYRRKPEPASWKTLLTGLKHFFRRIIPYRVTLNGRDGGKAESGEEIASLLKARLGRLQGAYFDVEESRVDYRAMKASKEFRDYRKLTLQLNSFSFATLDDDDQKKAFWINIYNILIIHGVIHFDLERSVRQVPRFFRRIGYRIGGIFFSPDDIEHGILRRNRPHPLSGRKIFSSSDPRNRLAPGDLDDRIHFALVCASSSCPPIEFYDSARIDEQLDLAARSFLKRRGLVIDREKKIVHLSPIFKWYRTDFIEDGDDILAPLLPYLKEDERRFIEENRRDLEIKYLPYNWNLNSRLV